jgi:hypothetical protein
MSGNWLWRLGAVGLMLLGSSAALAQVDLDGTWGQLVHQDLAERGTGPEFGDYTALPMNKAALGRADTWDADKWTVLEHQCEPHPADYAPHGPANLRIWSEIDPESQKIVAWHLTHSWMVTERSIWMDGRQHPPPEARHTWMGFSTGQWRGDVLEVRTDHLKEGWIRRNGAPRSDAGKLTEFFIRHGSYLTLVSVVDDPLYYTAPVIRAWNWVLNLGYEPAPYPCTYRVDADHPKGYVAHFLPGTNPNQDEFWKKHNLPREVARGGEEEEYPEYRHKLAQLMSEQSRTDQDQQAGPPSK